MQRITIRINIVVEYDGPSLSDTSSISSFHTEITESDGTSEGSNRSSGLSGSQRGYGRSGLNGDMLEEEEDQVTEYGRDSNPATPGVRQTSVTDPFEHLNIRDERDSPASGSTRLQQSAAAQYASQHQLSSRQAVSNSFPPIHLPLTGPDSAPAPALLTHSELGSRWLKEQSHLVIRRTGPASRNSFAGTSYDSEDEEVDGEEESYDDLALVRDARGSKCSRTVR